MNLDTIVQADALEWLRTLPDESVNCMITSPPYFSLRDYGIDGQIGLEDTLPAFIARLVAVFHEARRLERHYLLCDLSAEYVTIAQERLANSDPYCDTTLPDGSVQLSLFSDNGASHDS